MISRSDTYLTATVSMEFDATVQLPSPVHDAVTGQTTSTLTLDDPPARYAVEAGYDAAGAFVFNQYSLDPPGDPLTQSVSPAQTVSLHNGRFEFFDDGGEPILGTGTGSGPSLQTMMNAPSSEALQILDEMVLSKAPLTGTTTDFDGASVNVTSVSQSGDLVTVQAQISTPEPGLPTLPQRRTYRQTFVGGAERLTLLEVRTDIATSAGASQVSGTAIIRVDGLRFSRSAAGDQLRASGTAGNAFGSAPANIGPYIPPPCEPDDEYCDPNDPGTSGTGNSDPNAGSQPGCGYVTGGANLVFVHGILINGDTWGDPAYDNRIRGRTRCGLAVANDIAPTLSQGSRHSTQTNELRTAVAASGRQQNIFIGHSQGGLISRRAAQSYTLPASATNPYHHPSRVRGLVTIGTPHVGANIARNLPTNVLEDAITVFAQPLASGQSHHSERRRSGFRSPRRFWLSSVDTSMTFQIRAASTDDATRSPTSSHSPSAP